MKRSRTLSVSDIVKAWMEEEPTMHEHLKETEAMEVVHNIFGPLKRYIAECRIVDGTLTLRLYSSAMKHQILLTKADLIQRINNEIDAELIRDIEIY